MSLNSLIIQNKYNFNQLNSDSDISCDNKDWRWSKVAIVDDNSMLRPFYIIEQLMNLFVSTLLLGSNFIIQNKIDFETPNTPYSIKYPSQVELSSALNIYTLVVTILCVIGERALTGLYYNEQELSTRCTWLLNSYRCLMLVLALSSLLLSILSLESWPYQSVNTMLLVLAVFSILKQNNPISEYFRYCLVVMAIAMFSRSHADNVLSPEQILSLVAILSPGVLSVPLELAHILGFEVYPGLSKLDVTIGAISPPLPIYFCSLVKSYYPEADDNQPSYVFLKTIATILGVFLIVVANIYNLFASESANSKDDFPFPFAATSSSQANKYFYNSLPDNPDFYIKMQNCKIFPLLLVFTTVVLSYLKVVLRRCCDDNKPNRQYQTVEYRKKSQSEQYLMDDTLINNIPSDTGNSNELKSGPKPTAKIRHQAKVHRSHIIKKNYNDNPNTIQIDEYESKNSNRKDHIIEENILSSSVKITKFANNNNNNHNNDDDLSKITTHNNDNDLYDDNELNDDGLISDDHWFSGFKPIYNN